MSNELTNKKEKEKKVVFSKEQLDEIECLKNICPKELAEMRSDSADRLILVRMGNAVKGDFNNMQKLLELNYSSATYAGDMKAKNIRNEYFDGDVYDQAIAAIEATSYKEVMNTLSCMVGNETGNLGGNKEVVSDEVIIVSMGEFSINKENKKNRTFVLDGDVSESLNALNTDRVSVSEWVNFSIRHTLKLLDEGKIKFEAEKKDLRK